MRKLLSLLTASLVWGLAAPAGACPPQADRLPEPTVGIKVHYKYSTWTRPMFPPILETDIIIDSKDLSPDQVKHLRKLIEEARFFELESTRSDVELWPEPLAYHSLTVEMDGRKHTVGWDGGVERKELEQLVAWVQLEHLKRQIRELRLRPFPDVWPLPPIWLPIEEAPRSKAGADTRRIHPNSVGAAGFLEIIGEPQFLEAFILEFIPEGVPALVVINGQTYWLDLRGYDLLAKAQALKGKKVALTGWLHYRPLFPSLGAGEARVIIVNSLEAAKDPSADPVVRIQVTGTLTVQEVGGVSQVPVLTVSVNGRTYHLSFDSEELRLQAEKYVGQRVDVNGTLQGGVVTVTHIAEARLA